MSQLNQLNKERRERTCDQCTHYMSWTEYGNYEDDCNIGMNLVLKGTAFVDRCQELSEEGKNWIECAPECKQYERPWWSARKPSEELSQ
jgi:hypothetical protein